MPLLLRTLASAAAAILTGTAATAQTFPTPAEVEQYVREIHAQIQTHGRGDLPYQFFRELNRLSAPFELPQLPLEVSRTRLPEAFAAAADSLLRALGPMDAFREAIRRDSESVEPSFISITVARMIRTRNGARTLLEVLDSDDRAAFAVAMLLQGNVAPRAALEDTVRTWLNDAGLDEDSRAAVRANMLQFRIPYDHDATVAVIRADPHPGVRAQGIWYALTYRREMPPPDFGAVLAEGLSAAFDMPHGEWRTRMLTDYAGLCARETRAPCADYDLPRIDLTHDVSNRVINAAYMGEVGLADSLLAEMDAGVMGEPGLLALVSTTLARPCAAGTGCATAIAPLRDRWLPRLRSFAASTLPQADTVRANLVVVIAATDPGAALDLHRTVQDSALAQRAAWTAAQSVLQTDFWTAVELMRNNIRRGWSNEVVGAIYLRLMGLRESDLAAQILASERSSSSRLYSRLRWAEALYRVGRVDQARTTALAALADWDPAIDPIAGAGMFRIYEELGLYPRLIDWAWSRPAGPARAGALLSVLEGLRRVE